MFVPKKVVIHCSASPNGKLRNIDNLYHYHVNERGFSKIGYHVYINTDGQHYDYANDQRLRALNEQGAGVAGANSYTVHICLAGTDAFTKAQFYKLRDKCDAIRMVLNLGRLPDDYITMHYEYESAQAQLKTCPNIEREDLVEFLRTGDISFVSQYLYVKPKLTGEKIMPVEKVSYSMEVPKESKEIVDAIVAIYGGAKAGGLAGATAALPALITAVDGYDKLADEAKSDGMDEIVGYAGHKIVEALRG